MSGTEKMLDAYLGWLLLLYYNDILCFSHIIISYFNYISTATANERRGQKGSGDKIGQFRKLSWQSGHEAGICVILALLISSIVFIIVKNLIC